MKSTAEIGLRGTLSHAPKLKRPVKVCQHVLRPARNDVRSNRTATALSAAGFAVTLIDVDSEAPAFNEENVAGIYLDTYDHTQLVYRQTLSAPVPIGGPQSIYSQYCPSVPQPGRYISCT